MMKKEKKIILVLLLAIACMAGVLRAPETALADVPTLSVKGEWSKKFELPQGGTNYHKFTITKAGETHIEFISYANNLEYSLCDSEFNRIDGQSRISGSETSPMKASMHEYLSQGTYYLAVTTYNGAGGGGYKLCVSFYSSNVTAADGDSFDLPQDIQVGKRISGIMTYSNKEDWYKLVISDAGIYNQMFYGRNESYVLYDERMSKISSLTAESRPKAVKLEPGIYYINIKDSEGSRFAYTLQITEVKHRKGEILPVVKGQNALYKVTKPGIDGTVAYYRPVGSPKASVVIPATVWNDGIVYKVTSISANAFKGSKKLKKVTVGKNVVSIGAFAFYNCSKLESIKLPSDVSTVGSQAFYKCARLKSITLPAEVGTIGKQSFYNCKNLKTITVKTKKLTASKVGSDAFKGIHSKAVIKIPKNKFNAYKKMLKKKGVGTQAVYKKLN